MIMRLPMKGVVPCSKHGNAASHLHLHGIIAFRIWKEGNARKGYVFIGYSKDASGSEISE